MKYLLWLLKAAIFFTLFAFALNNQQEVTVHFFFGTQWRAPLVLVVLAAFGLGLVAGVIGMIPRWWKQRKAAIATLPATTEAETKGPSATVTSSDTITSSIHGI